MMTETNPTASIAITDTDSKTPALPKSSTITLTAPNGATMLIVAERKGDAARTYVITTENKKSVRGMTEQHATFEAAQLATSKIAKAAEKLGWLRKQKRQGFAPKPDAFSTLPPAPKAKK